MPRETWFDGEQKEYINWDAQTICPDGGPTNYGDPCIYFQKPNDLKAIVIHHTGSDILNMANTRPGHLSSPLYDNIDIAFHFGVLKDGTVIEGRPILIRGSHTRGGNIGSVGIELEGDFNTDLPKIIQLEETINLVISLRTTYTSINFIGGHRDVMLAAVDEYTDCPGDAFLSRAGRDEAPLDRSAVQFANLYNQGLQKEYDSNGRLINDGVEYIAKRTGLTLQNNPGEWGTKIPGTATPVP
jgi:hypothetical protein